MIGYDHRVVETLKHNQFPKRASVLPASEVGLFWLILIIVAVLIVF
ncbi:hypothetical protein JXB02_04180 [Candidatus Woesearchaeota archaeon]|nr:hypothetical protein [Candidatus Woesearchaeota archaeon]